MSAEEVEAMEGAPAEEEDVEKGKLDRCDELADDDNLSGDGEGEDGDGKQEYVKKEFVAKPYSSNTGVLEEV